MLGKTTRQALEGVCAEASRALDQLLLAEHVDRRATGRRVERVREERRGDGVRLPLCDRCAVMYAGEIVERGPLDLLYHSPGHPYSRMLFAASPDLAGLDEPVVSIPGAPPRLDRPIDGCPFRPRCDSAFAACIVRPSLEPVANDHDAACHLNTKVPA